MKHSVAKWSDNKSIEVYRNLFQKYLWPWRKQIIGSTMERSSSMEVNVSQENLEKLQQLQSNREIAKLCSV